MLNIMLVDDEVLALDYLKNMVDWEKHGYRIAGCAASGKRALELYDRTKPEIVISDIRMPVMDGLELTRKLKEKNKAAEVILLSAYGDFEYAKKGIEYGVSNYLLKHELCEELLLEKLERIRERIEKKSRQEKIYQTYFMNQLIYDQADTENMEAGKLGNRLFLLLLHKRNPVCCGEVVQEQWNAAEREALSEVLEENLENMIFYAADVQITKNNWMVLYRIENTASTCAVNTLIMRKCVQISGRLARISDCRFNILHSFEITQREISATFRKMSHQIRYSVFWKVNKEYFLQDTPEEERKKIWGEQIRQLKEAVYECDGNPVQMVRSLFDNLRIGEKLEAYKSLMPLLNGLLGEIRTSENIGSMRKEEKLYTMEEIAAYYEENFASLHEQICSMEAAGYSRLVQDVIHYIRKNYKQELSLELLGEEFQMNGVYLGQIFRKETGITFLKYLTGVRIEEAKRLLTEENCTVTETAVQVGYRTSQYFSKVFVKTVGMTPQEYRKWKKKE